MKFYIIVRIAKYDGRILCIHTCPTIVEHNLVEAQKTMKQDAYFKHLRDCSDDDNYNCGYMDENDSKRIVYHTDKKTNKRCETVFVVKEIELD